MDREKMLQCLSSGDLVKCAIALSSFNELIEVLTRIANASERIAQSLENLGEIGIDTYPNN